MSSLPGCTPKITRHGVLLEPTLFPFERKAVLNPGVYQNGDTVHVYYRAVDEEGTSSIGYARLSGPTEVVERHEVPLLVPESGFESKGVEDPRVVGIEGTLYMTYVAHDGINAVTAYATAAASDPTSFVRKGIMSPAITYRDAEELFNEAGVKDQYHLFSSFYKENAGVDVLIWHKDVILFPEKVKGQFAMLHRILPVIQLAFFSDFRELTTEYWRKHIAHLEDHVVIENTHWFETRHIGGGAPPVVTPAGYLAITHAAEETNKGRVYRAGAALLDKDDPRKVMGKLHEPLFGPREEYEVGSTKNFEGDVANVVFPTGTAVFGDTLYIYYGAADRRIAVASASISELIQAVTDPRCGHAVA